MDEDHDALSNKNAGSAAVGAAVDDTDTTPNRNKQPPSPVASPARNQDSVDDNAVANGAVVHATSASVAASQSLEPATKSVLLEAIAASEMNIRAEVREVREELRAEVREVREGLCAEIREVREGLCAEIRGVREELRGEIKALREEMHGEIKTLREEMHGEIKALREELRTEIREVREELRGEIAGLRGDIVRLEKSMGKVMRDEVRYIFKITGLIALAVSALIAVIVPLVGIFYVGR